MIDSIDHLDFGQLVRFIYCDSAATQREGQRLAALYDGFVGGWRCDFGRLMNLLRRGAILGGGSVVGMDLDENDSINDPATRADWADKTMRFTANSDDVPTEMHASLTDIKIIEDLMSRMALDGEGEVVTLVAGSDRFIPIINKLSSSGVPVEVIFWTHATHPSLIEEADAFVPLDLFIERVAQDRPRTKFEFKLA